MKLVLGSTMSTKGCLTRLIDVVNREPTSLEELIGFNHGRLGQGFYVLLLKQPLAPIEFAFFGYTYMSGGRTGLPTNDPAVEQARPRVNDMLINEFGKTAADEMARNFAASAAILGSNRLTKIVPVIDHDPNLGAADQYPASKLGIAQVNLLVGKSFLVAAEVLGTNWRLANTTAYDVAARPRHDLPYSQDPRKRVFDYLSNA